MSFSCLIKLLKEDIKEVLPYVFPANCGEILRATVCSTSFNYLLIYLKDIVERFDASVIKFAAEADKHIIDPGKLPDQISQYKISEMDYSQADKHIIDPGKLPDQVSQYKISEMDYSRWIKWSEEVHVPSTIDKDAAISDIFITIPNFDRILTFAQRQILTTDQHLLFCGPQISGKTALVHRFIKHINSLSDAFIFYWLKTFNRFNLLKMQKILQKILQKHNQPKTIVLVVDCFAFNEATSGFLELLVNEKQIIVDGVPQNFEHDFRLIIIMNDTEYEKCYEKKIFVDNFISIFVHSPTKDELAFIFENLVSWHFQSQTFSGEYISLVTSLSAVAMKLFTTASIQPKRFLPYIIRLAKGIMFSSPENAPDIDSLLRLFIHEIIRVAVDRNLKKKAKSLFFTKINGAMIDECGTKVETLFPTKKQFIEEDSSDFYLMKKTENVTVGLDFTLEKLMFSELAAQETMEGISYSLVTDKEEFTRNVENLHFEFSKNHEDWQINLAVTDYVAEHCQRIMRVCRQAGEHLALAGRIGSGRYQCLKLSTFGVIGQIQHIFINSDNPNEFEKSWKRVMQECVLLIAKTNQPVNVVFHLDHTVKTIPQQWLGMLKHWLLTPTLDGLITDDNILKHGEQIVDCERTLATVMQSSNIRLPGQRYCQFVSLEALKDIEQLKILLSARVIDFLHAIFLIPPESLPMFEWCSADHFLPLTTEEEKNMGQKILSECIFAKKEHLLETLQNIFETTMELFTDHHPSFDIRLWFQLCQKTTNIYNTRTSATITEIEKNSNETEVDILQLQAKIDAIMDPLTTEEEKNMGQKFLSECIFAKKEHLLETLQNIFETTMELFTDHHPSFDVRLWFQLCQKTTNIYNTKTSAVQEQITMLKDALKTLSTIRQLSAMSGKTSTEELNVDLDDTDLILLMQKRHLNEDTKALDELTNTITEVEKTSNETEVDILQLQAKIDAIMDEPQKAFVVVAEEISEFSNSDFKKLSMTLKPTLAIRYSIEVLRRVIDSTFQSKKSTIETWPHLQENREMRIAKLETESKLAAVICKWVLAAIDVAEANLSVSEEQSSVKKAWEKLHQEREKLILLQKEKDKLEKSVAALKHNVEALEQKITKIKRTINYRQRGSKIVDGLSSLEPRWSQQIQTLNHLMNNLIGNSIYDAAFQTFLLDAPPEIRQRLSRSDVK
uniref:Uncharacterized protein n=1 Tax=Panagrolaimus sp. PS1159 TaxID=55785 RepID=A0AC35FA47_9BILA